MFRAKPLFISAGIVTGLLSLGTTNGLAGLATGRKDRHYNDSRPSMCGSGTHP